MFAVFPYARVSLMLNTSLLTKCLSGSGVSVLDFLSKFPFQLLNPVRNFLIRLEPVLLYTWSGISNAPGALNMLCDASYKAGIWPSVGLALCSLGTFCCSCLSNHSNRNKNVVANLFFFLKPPVTMYYFCYLISSTERVCVEMDLLCAVELTEVLDWNSSVLDWTSGYFSLF